jgi:hypothetical protein
LDRFDVGGSQQNGLPMYGAIVARQRHEHGIHQATFSEKQARGGVVVAREALKAIKPRREVVYEAAPWIRVYLDATDRNRNL